MKVSGFRCPQKHVRIYSLKFIHTHSNYSNGDVRFIKVEFDGGCKFQVASYSWVIWGADSLDSLAQPNWELMAARSGIVNTLKGTSVIAELSSMFYGVHALRKLFFFIFRIFVFPPLPKGPPLMMAF